MRAVLILLLSALAFHAQAESTVSADQLIYREIGESSQANAFNRILVTPEYVRFDDGTGRDGFLLYDRKQREIYSVNAEDRAILEIKPEPINALSKDAPKVEVLRKCDDKAPEVGGAKPLEVELLANGESCEKRLVVPGLMKPAVAGLAEYHRTLSWQQQASLSAIPVEMQNVCDLALNVFFPDLLVKEGLSFQRWGSGGRDELVDFSTGKSVDAKLFELPQGYRRQAM